MLQVSKQSIYEFKDHILVLQVYHNIWTAEFNELYRLLLEARSCVKFVASNNTRHLNCFSWPLQTNICVPGYSDFG